MTTTMYACVSFVIFCFHYFQTDPKNVDYVAEHGAVRTFQAHKVLEQQEEEKKREKEEQEANDPMLVCTYDLSICTLTYYSTLFERLPYKRITSAVRPPSLTRSPMYLCMSIISHLPHTPYLA
jgi:hypothetical protein